MRKKRQIAVRNESCLDCGFCSQYVACSAERTGCVGCGACIKGCPQKALRLVERPEEGPAIEFKVNGQVCRVNSPASVWLALEELGYRANHCKSGHEAADAFCGTGGCWNCAVLIDGQLLPSCVTPLQAGMEINTDAETIQNTTPLRIATLMRPPPHYHPSIFAHGCNFNCDLCHNWNLTFSSVGRAIGPTEAAARLNLDPTSDYWVGISGGEPTLNRRWLLETIREIRRLAPDIRIQLDTNGSLLTVDYIDELVESGVTDISPDLKAKRLDTFMKASGVTSEKTARFYLDTAWRAVRYLNDAYASRVFVAVSVPCHPRLHSVSELKEIAKSLVSINPEIPVTVIEYQPAFRLRDWPFIGSSAMQQVVDVFKSTGLNKVILQGGSEMPRAIDPVDLVMSSEEF